MQRRYALCLSFVLMLTTAGSGLLGNRSGGRAEAKAEPEIQHINSAGIAIIKDSEKLRLKSYEFGGHWYIGYGHLTKGAGHYITEATAQRLLKKDLMVCEDAVRGAVHEPVSDDEFSALTALCYNVGAPNFRETDVVDRLNDGDHDGAADAFLALTYADVGGKMKKLAALEERRKLERALFLSSSKPERTAEASPSQ